MNIRLRWLVVVLVLAAATTVALWPLVRHGGGQAATTTPPAAGPPAVDLAAARATAALSPCLQPLRAQQQSSPAPAAANPLRGVVAPCLGDGSAVDVGAALAGRTVLINVWASWCQPCRAELPALQAYARTPGAVPVLGLQVQSAPADGLALLSSLGVHLPVVYDQDSRVAAALHLPSYLPVSYVWRPDGTVQQVLPPTPFTSPEDVAAAVARYAGAAG